MSDIRLVDICKSYGDEQVLKNYDLVVPSGSFFALLGPSGCGKTTILRLIAGLEQSDSGKIFLGEEDITNQEINKRNVNTVFQNYALFPHLNVFENVAYSLRIKKVAESIIKQKVAKVLAAVHLEKQIHRSIDQLSGGQQQRVALARAIVNEPDVLLLDEPLAALDLKLREKMLVELIDLQSSLKTTFVYITHDQNEALAVADQMAIMNYDGKIEQIGDPEDIYAKPASKFVANFVGTTNILDGIAIEDGDKTKLVVSDDVQFTIPTDWLVKQGESISVSLRPEKIVISEEELSKYENKLEGIVLSVIFHGKATLYQVKVGDTVFQVFDQNRGELVFEIDEKANLYWQASDATVLRG